MKNILTNKFDVIRSKNPDRVVTNLVIGITIVIVLAVFSVWYFGDRNLFGENPDVTDELVESDLDETAVVVQRGEGLWQVAERVCGDGEFYNEIAEENGLSAQASLETGQVLKVNCHAYSN